MKRNKEKLIEELLLENYDKYFRIAMRYTGNEQDALDAVQEGAYKAIFHEEKLKNPAHADTWICRIIMNEAVEFLRKNRRYHEDITECQLETTECYEHIEVREAMEKLPLKDQLLISLRYFEDMSLEEVSRAVDLNISTVKSRLYRALAKLKINLSEENE